MEFWHYSDQNFKYDPDRKYIQRENQLKPYGFWFSVDDAWETWCYENNFPGEKLVTRSFVTINDFSNILIIEDIEQYQSFIDRFFFYPMEEPDWENLLQPPVEEDRFKTYEKFIEKLKEYWPLYKEEHKKPRHDPDWEAVSKEYAGIIMPKYYELYRTVRESDNFSYLWLSSWDVSSGCVWDLSIVTVNDLLHE